MAEIDLSAIAFNTRQVKNRVAPAGILAVVKADAYGHGVIKVSETILNNGANYLGAGIVEEGIEIRQAGIRAPILVLGGLFPEQADLFLEHDLVPSIYEQKSLQAFAAAAKKRGKKAKIHIKIDTGMGRVGVRCEQALSFIENALQSENIELEGIYTHFASADELDKSFTYLQLARFQDILEELNKMKIEIAVKHAANSAAILDVPESWFNFVRPGLMLYGYYPSQSVSKSVQLKPSLTLKSEILFIKEIDRGESVGYGRTFISRQKTRIATLPLGYADGYNRLLSNQMHVLIHGKEYPVVGLVAMDMITVDIGMEAEILEGDEVILLGSPDTNSELSIESVSRRLNTIPYEVTCRVSKRVPRVYLE